MNFEWRWDFTWQILPRMLEATLATLAAAAIGYSVALLGGLIFALGQRTSSRTITFLVREIVEFIRSTPLVLQIFFIYFVGPQFGIRMSPWIAGMLALGIHYSAYLSEVYRGGLDAVPKGQWEAALALNLSTVSTYTRIILPQALPPALPGMGNYLVGILKDTPLLSVIGVAELMHTANSIGAANYRFLEPYTIVGLIFLSISLPLSGLSRLFEMWVRRKLGMR
jgi:polar amino acid transport system permease protein